VKSNLNLTDDDESKDGATRAHVRYPGILFHQFLFEDGKEYDPNDENTYCVGQDVGIFGSVWRLLISFILVSLSSRLLSSIQMSKTIWFIE
jgi:hypothetical protein